MIVCHCQNITDKDIEAAIDWMRACDPDALITKGKIYRALGKRAQCGGCVSLFIDMMRRNNNLAIRAGDGGEKDAQNNLKGDRYNEGR